jgi:type IV pilus assembly protein PilX
MNRLQALKNERGAVLIVSLMILVILTLLGITAMQTTTFQEKMAGNMRSRELAFQAAEAALRQGEAFLQAGGLLDFKTVANSGGLYLPPAVGKDPWWTSLAWDDNDSVAIDRDIEGTIARPRYIIEELSIAQASSFKNIAAGTPLPQLRNYRITARGVGGAAGVVAILQSTYVR